ncbi:MAG: tellurite resistance TerB family protein [Azonexus sp.]|jgi:tellurite resistance protein TerB|nr:tellurite resistance TerB family protein [Azonexus sp.]
MSFLDTLKQSFKDVSKTMNTELKKFRSKDLLQAIVAGSTMMAYADGEVSAAEKQKLMGYVRNSEQLSVFDTDKVIEAFNQYLNRFEFDPTIAIGEALQKITVFKDKPESHLIVRVCLAIAHADGNFEDTERRALEQICAALNLDIKTFV